MTIDAPAPRAPIDLQRGDVVWTELDPGRGREQVGRRPALVVSSNLNLKMATTLVIVLPCTSTDRGWPNHVPLSGDIRLSRPTFAMTEQPRTITRDRLVGVAGKANAETMRMVDQWLRDHLAL